MNGRGGADDSRLQEERWNIMKKSMRESERSVYGVSVLTAIAFFYDDFFS